MNIFLTGQIQIGKSTALNKTLSMLQSRLNPNFGGFNTYHIAECRDVFMTEHGAPKINDTSRKIATWRHNCMEPHTEVFDKLGTEILRKSSQKDIIIMDELGFLERDAEIFKEQVFECLQSDIPCVGILRKANIPWHIPIYKDPNTKVIEVTLANRQGLPYEICDLLTK